jgi:transposase
VSPPYSPDLNPVEMVWNEMKTFVRGQFCKTPEEVAFAIETFRLSLTPEKCQNYIKKIYEVFLFKYQSNIFYLIFIYNLKKY